MLFKHVFLFWTALNGVKLSTCALKYNSDHFNYNERYDRRRNWGDRILVSIVMDNLINFQFNEF